MKLALAAIGLALTAQALSAPAASAQGPGCFYTRDIRNHTIVDKNTALINVDNRHVFRITTTGACFAAATSSDPLIMRNPPGSNTVCKPIDMDLGVKVAGGPTTRCIVSGITELTPAEVAALPKKLKP